MSELYRPSKIKVLLIGESPPYSESPDISRTPYFYNTKFVDNMRDSLLRETSKVILDRHICIYSERYKHEILSALKDKGVFLIDAVEQPINHLKGKHRKDTILKEIPSLLSRIKVLNPDRIIVVLTSVYDIIRFPLQAAGLPLVPLRIPSPWAAKTVGQGYKDFLKEALSYQSE